MRSLLLFFTLYTSSLCLAQSNESKYVRIEPYASVNQSHASIMQGGEDYGGTGFGFGVKFLIQPKLGGLYLQAGFNTVQHNNWSFQSGLMGSGTIWENTQVNAPHGLLGMGYRIHLNESSSIDLGIYGAIGAYYIRGYATTYSSGNSSETKYVHTKGSYFYFSGISINYGYSFSIRSHLLRCYIGLNSGTLKRLWSSSFRYSNYAPFPNLFIGIAYPFCIDI